MIKITQLKRIFLYKPIVLLVVCLFLFENMSVAGEYFSNGSSSKATLSPQLLLTSDEKQVFFKASLISETIEKRANYGEKSIRLDDLRQWASLRPTDEGFKDAVFHEYGNEVHIVVGGRILIRYFEPGASTLDHIFAGSDRLKTFLSQEDVTPSLRKQVYKLALALPAGRSIEDVFGHIIKKAGLERHVNFKTAPLGLDDDQYSTCRLDPDGTFVIDPEFVLDFSDIKNANIGFPFTFDDGVTRWIDVADSIVYRAAMHEFNLKGRDGQGHAYLDEEGNFKIAKSEEEANRVGRRYSVIDDAAWLWYLHSYKMGKDVWFDNNAFYRRLNWIFSTPDDDLTEDGKAAKIERDSFPNLRDDKERRNRAIFLALLINDAFFRQRKAAGLDVTPAYLTEEIDRTGVIPEKEGSVHATGPGAADAKQPKWWMVQKPYKEDTEAVAEERASVEIQYALALLINELNAVIDGFKNAVTDEEKMALSEREGTLIEDIRSLYRDMKVSVPYSGEEDFRFYTRSKNELMKEMERLYDDIRKAHVRGDKEQLAELNVTAVNYQRTLLKLRILLAGMLLGGKSGHTNEISARNAAIWTLEGALTTALKLEQELHFRVERLKGKKLARLRSVSDWMGNIVNTFSLGSYSVTVHRKQKGEEPSVTIRQRKWINTKTTLARIRRDLKKGNPKDRTIALKNLDMLIRLYDVRYLMTLESYKSIKDDLKAIRRIALGLPDSHAPPKDEVRKIEAIIRNLLRVIRFPKQHVWQDITFKDMPTALRGYVHKLTSNHDDIITITKNKAYLEFYSRELNKAIRSEASASKRKTVKGLSAEDREMVIFGLQGIFKWTKRGAVYQKQKATIALEGAMDAVGLNNLVLAKTRVDEVVNLLEERISEIKRISSHLEKHAVAAFDQFRDDDIAARAKAIGRQVYENKFDEAISAINTLHETYFDQDIQEIGYIRAKGMLRMVVSEIRGAMRQRDPSKTVSMILRDLWLVREDVKHKNSYRVYVTYENGEEEYRWVVPGTTAETFLSRNLRKDPKRILINLRRGVITHDDLPNVKIEEGAKIVLKRNENVTYGDICIQDEDSDDFKALDRQIERMFNAMKVKLGVTAQFLTEEEADEALVNMQKAESGELKAIREKIGEFLKTNINGDIPKIYFVPSEGEYVWEVNGKYAAAHFSTMNNSIYVNLNFLRYIYENLDKEEAWLVLEELAFHEAMHVEGLSHEEVVVMAAGEESSLLNAIYARAISAKKHLESGIVAQSMMAEPVPGDDAAADPQSIYDDQSERAAGTGSKRTGQRQSGQLSMAHLPLIGTKAMVAKVAAYEWNPKFTIIAADDNENVIAMPSLEPIDPARIESTFSDLASKYPEYREVLQAYLELLKKHDFNLFQFGELVGDIFGFADPGNKVLAVNKVFLEDGMAVFYLINKYLLYAGLIEISLSDGKVNLIFNNAERGLSESDHITLDIGPARIKRYVQEGWWDERANDIRDIYKKETTTTRDRWHFHVNILMQCLFGKSNNAFLGKVQEVYRINEAIKRLFTDELYGREMFLNAGYLQKENSQRMRGILREVFDSDFTGSQLYSRANYHYPGGWDAAIDAGLLSLGFDHKSIRKVKEYIRKKQETSLEIKRIWNQGEEDKLLEIIEFVERCEGTSEDILDRATSNKMLKKFSKDEIIAKIKSMDNRLRADRRLYGDIFEVFADLVISLAGNSKDIVFEYYLESLDESLGLKQGFVDLVVLGKDDQPVEYIEHKLGDDVRDIKYQINQRIKRFKIPPQKLKVVYLNKNDEVAEYLSSIGVSYVPVTYYMDRVENKQVKKIIKRIYDIIVGLNSSRDLISDDRWSVKLLLVYMKFLNSAIPLLKEDPVKLEGNIRRAGHLINFTRFSSFGNEGRGRTKYFFNELKDLFEHFMAGLRDYVNEKGEETKRMGISFAFDPSSGEYVSKFSLLERRQFMVRQNDNKRCDISDKALKRLSGYYREKNYSIFGYPREVIFDEGQRGSDARRDIMGIVDRIFMKEEPGSKNKIFEKYGLNNYESFFADLIDILMIATYEEWLLGKPYYQEIAALRSNVITLETLEWFRERIDLSKTRDREHFNMLGSNQTYAGMGFILDDGMIKVFRGILGYLKTKLSAEDYYKIKPLFFRVEGLFVFFSLDNIVSSIVYFVAMNMDDNGKFEKGSFGEEIADKVYGTMSDISRIYFDRSENAEYASKIKKDPKLLSLFLAWRTGDLSSCLMELHGKLLGALCGKIAEQERAGLDIIFFWYLHRIIYGVTGWKLSDAMLKEHMETSAVHIGKMFDNELKHLHNVRNIKLGDEKLRGAVATLLDYAENDSSKNNLWIWKTLVLAVMQVRSFRFDRFVSGGGVRNGNLDNGVRAAAKILKESLGISEPIDNDEKRTMIHSLFNGPSGSKNGKSENLAVRIFNKYGKLDIMDNFWDILGEKYPDKKSRRKIEEIREQFNSLRSRGGVQFGSRDDLQKKLKINNMWLKRIENTIEEHRNGGNKGASIGKTDSQKKVTTAGDEQSVKESPSGSEGDVIAGSDSSDIKPEKGNEPASATDARRTRAKGPGSAGYKENGSVIRGAVNEYFEENQLFLTEVLGEDKEAVLLRVPVEILKAVKEEQAMMFLSTIREAPNVTIELYSMKDGKLPEDEYKDYGIEKKQFKHTQTRANTITLFVSAKDEKIASDLKIMEKFGLDPDIRMENTILMPIGLYEDGADVSGLLRSTLLGLRLSRIARDKKAGTLREDFVSETLEQFKLLCRTSSMLQFGLTEEDIINLATGSKPLVIRALNKLIELLPIMPINAEEIRKMYENARTVWLAA